jgi:hypothetical protein
MPQKGPGLPGDSRGAVESAAPGTRDTGCFAGGRDVVRHRPGEDHRSGVFSNAVMISAPLARQTTGALAALREVWRLQAVRHYRLEVGRAESALEPG